MKRCPKYNRVETDDALVYSRADGTPLVAQTNVSDEAVTRTLQSPNQPDTIRADIRATGPTTVLPAGQKQFVRDLPASRSSRLNRSADVKHPGISTLRVDVMFDHLHSDPRFAELLKRVGI